MMMRDSAGFWTGYVQCDHPECKAYLSQDEIHVPKSLQDKVQRVPQSLLDRGWFCVMGNHYCPDHHPTIEDMPEEWQKYAAYWQGRLDATSASSVSPTTDISSTSTTQQGT